VSCGLCSVKHASTYADLSFKNMEMIFSASLGVLFILCKCAMCIAFITVWKQGMLSRAFLCTYIHNLFLINKYISNYPILLALVSSASEAISSWHYTNLLCCYYYYVWLLIGLARGATVTHDTISKYLSRTTGR